MIFWKFCYKISLFWQFFLSFLVWETIIPLKNQNFQAKSHEFSLFIRKNLNIFYIKSFANWLATCKSDLYKSDTCKRLATSSLLPMLTFVFMRKSGNRAKWSPEPEAGVATGVLSCQLPPLRAEGSKNKLLSFLWLLVLYLFFIWGFSSTKRQILPIQLPKNRKDKQYKQYLLFEGFCILDFGNPKTWNTKDIV